MKLACGSIIRSGGLFWGGKRPQSDATTVVVTRNTLVADGAMLLYVTPNTDPPISQVWTSNVWYHTGAAASAVEDNGTNRTYAAWAALYGLDAGGAYIQAFPTTNRIRTIARGDGKTIVAIYNWEGLASVAAPIAGTYVNVLNPVESVVLTAGAALTMSGWTVAIPVGDTVAQIASTFPQFGCFLVTP